MTLLWCIGMTLGPAAASAGTAWRHYEAPARAFALDLPAAWRTTDQRVVGREDDPDTFEIGFVPPGEPDRLETMRLGVRLVCQRLEQPASLDQAEQMIRRLADEAGESVTLGPSTAWTNGAVTGRLLTLVGQEGTDRSTGWMLVLVHGQRVIVAAAVAPQDRLSEIEPLATAVFHRLRLPGAVDPSGPRFYVSTHQHLAFRLPPLWAVKEESGPLADVQIVRVTDPSGQASISMTLGPAGLAVGPSLEAVEADLRQRFGRVSRSDAPLSTRRVPLLEAADADGLTRVYDWSDARWALRVVAQVRLPAADAVRAACDNLLESLYVGFSPNPDDLALPDPDEIVVPSAAGALNSRALMAYVRYCEFLASLATQSRWRLERDELVRVVQAWAVTFPDAPPDQRQFFAEIEARWHDAWVAWQAKTPQQKAAFAQLCQRQYGWLRSRRPRLDSEPANLFEELLMNVHARRLGQRLPREGAP